MGMLPVYERPADPRLIARLPPPIEHHVILVMLIEHPAQRAYRDPRVMLIE